jgi:hypothetical protein
MAAKNQLSIKVNLTNEVSVDLASSSPDFDNFVEKVVEFASAIVPDDISVTCSSAKFDSVSFEEIIKSPIKDFLEKIKLEQKTVDAEIARLQDETGNEE